MSFYLVDVGSRTPLRVNVEDAAAAAFAASLALAERSKTMPAVFAVTGDGGVWEFKLADRKCRKCGCTEERACTPGGCCWMAWDLCSRCV